MKKPPKLYPRRGKSKPKSKPKSAPASVLAPQLIDKHMLYELCAQNPARDARVVRAIYADHAGFKNVGPVLGEDFAGTAALSAAWCDLLPEGSAVAVDHDANTLARAHQRPRLNVICSDVMRVNEPADCIAVLNFSICELHARERLVAYLAHARSRLGPHPRPPGSIICDLYGGSDVLFTGRLDQRFVATPPAASWGTGERITYTWEQRTSDPLTGRVVNAMHFVVRPPARKSKSGKPTLRRFDDAFVYDWRLWSVPELRDAMLEAGFSSTQVYPRTADAMDQDGGLYLSPIEDPAEVGDAFNVFVVGRV